MTLADVQAAIDLAWQYTDDPDECDKLSAANAFIEALRTGIAGCVTLAAQREAVMDTEAETGRLDADAIHGIEDDACEVVAWLAGMAEDKG